MQRRHLTSRLRSAAAACVVAACALAAAPAVRAGLQEQIDAAAPGATLTVPAGTYPGALLITRPLTLVGVGRPMLAGPGRGSVLRIAAPGVTVRGFRLRGSGTDLSADDAGILVTADHVTLEDNDLAETLHGIYLKKVRGARILRNRIRGFTTLAEETGPVTRGLGRSAADCDLQPPTRGNGIHQWNCQGSEIAGNTISDVRDGIFFSFTDDSRCTDNHVSRVRYGLHYMYSDGNVFTGNTFADSAAGAALMFSKHLEVRGNRFVGNHGYRAYGLLLQSVDDSRFEGNRIEGNAVGLSLNQCNRNRLVGNRVARNHTGLRLGANSDENAFASNVFARNLQPLELHGENGSNVFSLAGVGNFWEGAPAYDFDRDGIGDVPHRELDPFGVLRREFPEVALLADSPLLRLLRFAHQRLALPGFDSVEDRAPLTAAFLARHPGTVPVP